MLDQLLHVLHEHVLVFVAFAAVENYMLQKFFRGIKVLLSRPETISPLTVVTASNGTLATLAIIWLNHFFATNM